MPKFIVNYSNTQNLEVTVEAADSTEAQQIVELADFNESDAVLIDEDGYEVNNVEEVEDG